MPLSNAECQQHPVWYVRHIRLRLHRINQISLGSDFIKNESPNRPDASHHENGNIIEYFVDKFYGSRRNDRPGAFLESSHFVGNLSRCWPSSSAKSILPRQRWFHLCIPYVRCFAWEWSGYFIMRIMGPNVKTRASGWSFCPRESFCHVCNDFRPCAWSLRLHSARAHTLKRRSILIPHSILALRLKDEYNHVFRGHMLHVLFY